MPQQFLEKNAQRLRERKLAADAGGSLGIMGGTFDPVHNGHLAIAQSAYEQLGLDRVLFIPTGNPNFKQGQAVTPAKKRARMVELAIADYPHFELDCCEIERAGITYTADTLEELAERFPQVKPYFIMGADSAATLVHWRRAEKVAELCTVVVAKRPGQSIEQVRKAHEEYPLDFSILYLDVPQIDVSSTMIRECVCRGESVAGMLPDSVIDYIMQEGLYLE